MIQTSGLLFVAHQHNNQQQRLVFYKCYKCYNHNLYLLLSCSIGNEHQQEFFFIFFLALQIMPCSGIACLLPIIGFLHRYSYLQIIGFLLEVLGLVFWNSIHLEVASASFCLLINSLWLLVFILSVFFMILSGFNLYCWKEIHFSQNNILIFPFIGLIIGIHYWFRDLLRELPKKYEVLLIVFFLVFLLFLASEALLFLC